MFSRVLFSANEVNCYMHIPLKYIITSDNENYNLEQGNRIHILPITSLQVLKGQNNIFYLHWIRNSPLKIK